MLHARPVGETLERDTRAKRDIEFVPDLTGGKMLGHGGTGRLPGVNPYTLRYRMRKPGIAFRKESKPQGQRKKDRDG